MVRAGRLGGLSFAVDTLAQFVSLGPYRKGLLARLSILTARQGFDSAGKRKTQQAGSGRKFLQVEMRCISYSPIQSA